MGMRPSAVIAYGIKTDELSGRELEDTVSNLLELEYFEKEWGEESAKYKRLEGRGLKIIEKLRSLGISIWSFGNNYCQDEPIVLGLDDTGASCGYGVEELDAEQLIVPKNAARRLKAACKLLELEYSDPKWYMGADYD